MSKLRIAALVCLSTLLAPLAEAHPGHGTTEPAGLLHFISEPDHAYVALLAIVAAVLTISALVRKSRGA